MIEVPVSDGISKAEQLINRAMAGKASVYHGNGASVSKEVKSGGGVGHQIYKHMSLEQHPLQPETITLWQQSC